MLITSFPGSILGIDSKPSRATAEEEGEGGGIVGDTIVRRGLTDGAVVGMDTVADEATVFFEGGGGTVGGRGTAAAAEATVDCVDTVGTVDGAVTVGGRDTVETVCMPDGMVTVDSEGTVVLEEEGGGSATSSLGFFADDSDCKEFEKINKSKKINN